MTFRLIDENQCSLVHKFDQSGYSEQHDGMAGTEQAKTMLRSLDPVIALRLYKLANFCFRE